MSSNEAILGLSFFTGKKEEVLLLLKKGGLLTAPAAPALVELGRDRYYTEALQQSDIVITDSGLMVVLWFLVTGKRLPKLSGLKLLKLLLSQENIKKTDASFWIKPGQEAEKRTQSYLNNHGFSLRKKDFYVAPMYADGAIKDPELLEILNKKRPSYVFINIGGGKQELLGLYLKKNLRYSPAIVCTGAAIAFLTGEQANIPTWADRLSLGWFFRCLNKPRIFGKRYFKALKLIPLLFRHKEHLPSYDT